MALSNGGISRGNFVVAAGRTFNLPLIVQNLDPGSVEIQARYVDSGLEPTQLPGKSTGGYFLPPAVGEVAARAGAAG